MKNPTRAQAIEMLWRQGVLTWKLKPVQRDLYDSLENIGTIKTAVWNVSRRLGKSYCLAMISIERCLKTPNTIVKFIAPTQKQVRNILRPIFQDVLQDCPDDLRPEYKSQEHIWSFKNGSEIQLAGTDGGHADSLRGGSAHLCIVDEAGFATDLKNVMKSILLPTTLTTRGKIILSSTPPMEPDHDYIHFLTEAKQRGTYITRDVYAGLGSTITQVELDEMIDEYGGVDSDEFKREFLCEIGRGTGSNFVVPEAREDMLKTITKEWTRPGYFDIYEGADIGFTDLTVILFAYYDFREAKLIIEDELVMNGPKMTTEFFASELKRKERELYLIPQTDEVRKPYMRVSDHEPILLNDLDQLHGIIFTPTDKDQKDAALNNMRVMLKTGKIIIHPRCKTLLSHLENARWNKTRKSYVRDINHGHFDAVDALSYLCRNIVFSRNPYPPDASLGENWFQPQKAPLENATPVQRQISSWFKVKSSLRRFNK